MIGIFIVWNLNFPVSNGILESQKCADKEKKSIELQRKLILYHLENDNKQGGVGFSNYKCGVSNYMETIISNSTELQQ